MSKEMVHYPLKEVHLRMMRIYLELKGIKSAPDGKKLPQGVDKSRKI